jgi:hypothetical protein
MMLSLVACAFLPVEPTEPADPTDPPRTLLPNVTPNRVSYKTLPSLVVRRDLTINAGIGEKVIVSQVTDAHLNDCNEEDLKDPVLAETYKLLTWGRDKALTNLQNVLKVAAKDSDMMVLTGDLFSYYSQCNMQMIQEHAFEKYDNLIAIPGNHETYRTTSGSTLKDPMTYEERRALVAAGWGNDITYVSQIIKDRVMVIALDNGSSHFLPEQVPLLTADLQKARENGYVVLLFYHIPILTGDPDDNYKEFDSKYHSGDSHWSFGTEMGHNMVGKYSIGADKQIYDLICNNGDIIYGTFCGHVHADYYTEIHAKTASGEEIMIPQYMIQGSIYDNGHFLKITIE